VASGPRPAALILALVAFVSAGCTVTIITRGAPPPLPPRMEGRAHDAERVHDVGRRTPASPEPARWGGADSRPVTPAPGQGIRPERTPATPDSARAQSRATHGGASRATRVRAGAAAGPERGPAVAADEPARSPR